MALEVVYLKPEELKVYEKNARHHETLDVDAIAASIEQFGMNDPIGIWSNENIIVEGHGRLLACKKLNMPKVPCIRLDHLTDEQRKAYALAHNKTAELSSWDFDLLQAELDTLKDSFDMSDFGFETEDEDDLEVKEDDYDPIIPEEPNSKPGEIYKLGNHYLMCGDSTSFDDVSKLLRASGVEEPIEVDLFYTDPPYNVNVENSEGMKIANDDLDDISFKNLLDKAFENASRFLKPGGSFYVWHGDSERVNFQTYLERYSLWVKQCLIWVKNGFNFGRQDYKWQHEPCLYGWKFGNGHYFVPEYNHPTVIEDSVDLDKMKKDELKALCESLLKASIPSSIIHEDKPLKNDLHPTMKPLTICGLMIHNSSRSGENVLDLFGGSGSTLIACEQLKRNCYMMELDPAYVDVIIDRWEKFTGGKAEKL